MHPVGVKLFMLCMSVMGSGDNHPHSWVLGYILELLLSLKTEAPAGRWCSPKYQTSKFRAEFEGSAKSSLLHLQVSPFSSLLGRSKEKWI